MFEKSLVHFLKPFLCFQVYKVDNALERFKKAKCATLEPVLVHYAKCSRGTFNRCTLCSVQFVLSVAHFGAL